VYSILYAKQHLNYRPAEDIIGNNLLVSGYVSGIPVSDGDVQRFEFNLESYRLLTSKNNGVYEQTQHKFPQKLRLSWYYGEQVVNAGEKWQFEVRLKPPHGFLNPGGFDYEAWLFQHGIHATGYVRQSTLNQSLDSRSPHTFIGAVNRFRQSISQQIDDIASNHAHSTRSGIDETGSFALVKALSIGHKSSISNKQWQVLINTGTSHLMEISGLHI
jgi:competence protein ComEC